MRERLGALLPLAHRLAGLIGARVPMALADDVRSAAVLGAWLAVVGRPELSGDDLARYAWVRVRGAILDELRRHDWMTRRMRSGGADMLLFSLDALDRDVADLIGQVPAEQHEDAENAETARRLRMALTKLKPRERRILTEHYGFGRRLSEIAQELGVSGGRVSQLHAQAIRRVRLLLKTMPSRVD